MHIFISGCQGVGKTTLVNKISVDAPLAKFTDVDMIPDKSISFQAQLKRLTIYREVLESLPTHMNTLIDRSPFDFLVYIEKNPFTDDEQYLLMENWDNLMTYFNKNPDNIVIVLDDSFNAVWQRILKRGRVGRAEMEEKYTLSIWEGFKDLYNKYTIHKHVNEAEAYIRELLSIK